MFEDGRDAEDALMYLRNVRLSGRDLEIQYAEGDRKSESCNIVPIRCHLWLETLNVVTLKAFFFK